jgi:hypothetical protein
MPKPTHFVASLTKAMVAPEPPREIAEDGEIAARAVHRLDRLTFCPDLPRLL